MKTIIQFPSMFEITKKVFLALLTFTFCLMSNLQNQAHGFEKISFRE